MQAGRQLMGSPAIKTRAFKGYTPTANDVFVCTFAKSGTYWMLQIVTQIAGRGTADFEHIHDLVPWPEAPLPGLVRLSDPTWQTALLQKRAIKTHAEAHFIPYNQAAKYIVILRDPKDVLISSFHFAEALMPGLSSMGLEAWSEIFVSGETPHGIWAAHIASFWPWRERNNVMFVTFAEMKQDLAKVVRAVAALMGVKLNALEEALVIEKSSFAYMKAIESRFEPPAPLVRENPVKLIRKGQKGEAFEHLTPNQLATFDQAMKTWLRKFDSDFPYDDYFGSRPVC
jgi:hypothetical protein